MFSVFTGDYSELTRNWTSNPVWGAKTVPGGFDSHALPPFFAGLHRGGFANALRRLYFRSRHSTISYVISLASVHITQYETELNGVVRATS